MFKRYIQKNNYFSFSESAFNKASLRSLLGIWIGCTDRLETLAHPRLYKVITCLKTIDKENSFYDLFDDNFSVLNLFPIL